MENYKIVTVPIICVAQSDWRIRDYKVRILNKVNKPKRTTLEKYARLEDIERLTRLTMKRFRLSEFEALCLINKELTLKEMSEYAERKSTECGR